MGEPATEMLGRKSVAEEATIAPRRQVEVGTEVPCAPSERRGGKRGTVGYTVGWKVGLSLRRQAWKEFRLHGGIAF